MSTLHDFLRVLNRRKWLAISAVAPLPAAAVLFSLQLEPLYESSAQVLLGRQNLAATLAVTPNATPSVDPRRAAETQVQLAQVPDLARRVLDTAGIRSSTPQDLLEASTVAAVSNTDLLEFIVTDASPAAATRLATIYAREFTFYRRDLERAALREALKQIGEQLERLTADGAESSPLAQNLRERQQELRAVEPLQVANAVVVRTGGPAEQVQPRLARNVALGFVLGVFLAIPVALLRDARDNRVRSAGEIGERLGLPLLARVPEPPRHLRRDGGLVMLADSDGAGAEAYRVLRTSLEFVNLYRPLPAGGVSRRRAWSGTMMVTSAIDGEGKSTTAANLAIAIARSGRRVVLVDLALHRPSLDTVSRDAPHVAALFRLPRRPGLTDVALGHVGLDDAISSVAIAEADHTADGSHNGSGGFNGTLGILASGPIPPNAGELVAASVVTGILAELRGRADIVVLDTPPLLHRGDALALSASADGILVVARLNVVTRPMLTELRRVLGSSPAYKLGYVLTGADYEEPIGYALADARPPTRGKRETVA